MDELVALAADRGLPELAVREGERVPDDLPRGDCVFTRLADGGLLIDQADPRILISEQLLESIARHAPTQVCVESDDGKVIGSLLTIRGVNREVVYRITAYLPRVRGYIGEQPD